MSKAAAFHAPGGPEVLVTIEREPPQAGPGEVRIRAKAAGVQQADCAIRGGWTPPGATLAFPQVVGNECAGVVDQVGDGVEGFAVGDEAIGFRTLECYAQHVVVPADSVVPKPAEMPWELAASLSASGQAAHTAIVDELAVTAGDLLLVNGASGGVGTIALQLATLRGAQAIGVASEPNHEYLRSLGATPVAYGDGLRERLHELAPDGVDAFLDAGGGDGLAIGVELVKDKARAVTLVDPPKAAELGISFIGSKRTAARLAELTGLWTEGKLKLHVAMTFPLEQAAEAHRQVEPGHARGKVVLTID